MTEPDIGQSSRVLPLRFTASGSEYFRIWVVNLLLTVVTLGFYLVVSEEPGQWIRPTNPKTGDRFPLGWYAGMMAVTGTALAMLGLGGRRRRSDEEQTGGKAGR